MSAVVASTTKRPLPECWGHRGASARFPENTLASFEAAMRDGAEGIESDVHVSLDDVIVMFHDPDLFRTTGSKGLIRERKWYGEDGMEHCRTLREPRQAIPTFAETVALLVNPENRHVKFNVDVKPQNDPEHLFKLMHTIISAQEDWETQLAPRILLGLWHPKFIAAAIKIVPYLRRSYIGASLTLARDYFWDACHVFSIHFASLATTDGAKFRKEAKDAGKEVIVWTVNKPEQMMECCRWEVSAILTDVTQVWLDLRKVLADDFDKGSQYGRMFLWTSPVYYSPLQLAIGVLQKKLLEKVAGPFVKIEPESSSSQPQPQPEVPVVAPPVEFVAPVIPTPPAPAPAPAPIAVAAA